MNIIWKIANLKRVPSSGLVFEVVYLINFELENEIDRYVNIATFEGNPSNPGFVSFEQLTEPVIIDWVKAQLGNEKINAIVTEVEIRLQERINEKNNPAFLEGVPWNK